MKKIKYIGYYDAFENNSENRNFVLSASNKMTYICKAINKAGYNVEVVSASQSLNKKGCKKKIINLTDNFKIKLPFCIGNGNKIKKVIDRFIIRIQLVYELILNTKKNDTVLVYHSLGYVNTIKFCKAIRNFRLILEIEEIYGDVIKSQKTINNELSFFKKADAYLFPTVLLDEKINIQNKPNVIIHGTYKIEEDRKCKFEDDKIHCVYSGTFDPRKGGAAAAAAAAAYLDFHYHIHIIGFGSENNKKNMQDLIYNISKKTDCTLTYDGLLNGEEYIEFLQKCHIGFSTQNPDADFNDTSFPSKILSYMANRLRVVSIKIKALETSAVNDLLYYYDKDTPEEIAKAVKKIDLNDDYNSREKIKELDEKFVKEIKNIFTKKWEFNNEN